MEIKSSGGKKARVSLIYLLHFGNDFFESEIAAASPLKLAGTLGVSPTLARVRTGVRILSLYPTRAVSTTQA